MGSRRSASAPLECLAACRRATCISTPCLCSSAQWRSWHGAGAMVETVLLNAVLFLPLIGVAALLVLPAQRDGLVRGLSLAVMIVQFAVTAWLYLRFDPAADGLQFETRL